jgi:hypothetical protein
MGYRHKDARARGSSRHTGAGLGYTVEPPGYKPPAPQPSLTPQSQTQLPGDNRASAPPPFTHRQPGAQIVWPVIVFGAALFLILLLFGR